MNATALLVLHIQAKNLPAPEFEYRFHPKRRWRWDLAWVEVPINPRVRPHDPDGIFSLAVEIHGGVFRNGRHNRGRGFTNDRTKVNAGVEMGWRVLEYTTEQVESGEAIRQLERILGPRTENPCAPSRRRGKGTDVAGATGEV